MDGLRGFMSERGAFLLDVAPLVCLANVAVLLEYRFPRKDKRLDGFRWMTSVTLTLSGLLVVQLLVPVSALVAAKVSEAAGAGLLNTIDL